MFYIVDSDKSFYEASSDLGPVVQRLGFSVLHVHDLGGMLGNKDVDCDEEAKVFEIGSARLTEKLLTADWRLNMALPCRISVFTEQGVTKLGLIRLQPMLAELAQNVEVARIACELEEKMIQIIDEAR